MMKRCIPATVFQGALRYGRALLALAIGLTALAQPGPASAKEIFRYYPETGHYVNGEWLEWYLAHGGPEVLGAPRTEDYRDRDRLNQYFRTIRLEWDCGSNGKEVCVLRPGILGEEISGRKLDLTPDKQTTGVLSGDARLFPEADRMVQGDFLALFDRLGGTAFFGLPLTNEVVEAGQTVQWFQRARIERGADGAVRLSRLGDYWIDSLKRVGLITTLKMPGPQPLTALPATGLAGRLAYRADDGSIAIMNLADGVSRAVTTGNEPALSPDGTQVAFSRTAPDDGIWLLDLGTGQETLLTNFYGARSPIWSPDGTRLAILTAKQDPIRRNDPVSRRPGWALEDHYSVAVLDIGSRTMIDLPSMTFSSFPTWSPDGKSLIFDGNDGLYRVPADSSGEPLPVGETSRVYSQPAWSPDGSLIAVTYKKNDNYDLAVMRPDGSGFQQVALTPMNYRQSNNVAPEWSPDGGRLAFLSDRDGSWRAYVLTLSDGSIRPLFDTSVSAAFTFADERALSWSR